MQIAVIGATGLIGRKLVGILRDRGHVVAAVSKSSGVDVLTGAGLQEALAGAEVVVDVTNSPSFEDAAVMRFFETSARHMLPVEKAAGVRHHVALSVVGAERLPSSGYMRAKIAQERAIESSGIPHTIVRATQFHEFVGAITDASTKDDEVRLPPATLQTIAANDVAAALGAVANEPPTNRMIEIGGPETIGADELARRWLRAHGDRRSVVTDPGATYFGAPIDDRSLTTGGGARLGSIRFDAWLEHEIRA